MLSYSYLRYVRFISSKWAQSGLTAFFLWSSMMLIDTCAYRSKSEFQGYDSGGAIICPMSPVVVDSNIVCLETFVMSVVFRLRVVSIPNFDPF